nr:hypothetical protein LKV13_04745 [Borrelia sp. BU AG58]
MRKINIFALMLLLSVLAVSCRLWGEVDANKGEESSNGNLGSSSPGDRDKDGVVKPEIDGVVQPEIGGSKTGDGDELAQGGVVSSNGAGAENAGGAAATNGEAAAVSDGEAAKNGDEAVKSVIAAATRGSNNRSGAGEVRPNGSAENENKQPVIAGSANEDRPDGGSVNKLNKEDIKKKFNTLASHADEYGSKLTSIYNNYIGASNEIKTYSGDDDGWDPPAYDGERKKALNKFNDGKLYDEFRQLGDIIKGHRRQSLTDSIDKFEKAVGEALKTDKAGVARAAADSYLEALHSAIVSYIESFSDVVSTLPSGQFKQAAQEFVKIAKECAEINKTDVSVFTWAVNGVILEKNIALGQAKRMSVVLYGEKGKELSSAIDAMVTSYSGSN